MSEGGKKPQKAWHDDLPMRPILIVGAFIFAAWAGSGLAIWLGFQSTDRGLFGDMFGAINALFSGLAFAGLIVAIFLQKQELRLQREELEATREELEGQKVQLEAQTHTMQSQNFDSAFFALIRVWMDVIRFLSAAPHGGRQEGRECLESLGRVLWTRISQPGPRALVNVEKRDPKEVVNMFGGSFFDEFDYVLGHYFRFLEYLLSFISDQKPTSKQMYVDAIRCQMSTFEVVLLFYRCVLTPEDARLKLLVERCSLLADLPDQYVLSPALRSRFSPSAFNDSLG